MSQRPHENSPFKRALMAGMSDTLPVPLAEQMDPYLADAKNLASLAAHYSVDLWFDDWPEERKRELIAQYSGESVIYPGESLPELKGTREGARRYLELVDADLVDVIAYPAHAFAGRAVAGRSRVGFPPFKAIYLVRVSAYHHGAIAGRSKAGRCFARRADRTPYNRAIKALQIAKAVHTEIRVDFQMTRRWQLGDAAPLESAYRIGQHLPRTKL